jgi:hypothetical protein
MQVVKAGLLKQAGGKPPEPRGILTENERSKNEFQIEILNFVTSQVRKGVLPPLWTYSF